MTRRKRRKKKSLFHRNVGWLPSLIVIAAAMGSLFLYLTPKIQSYKKKNIAVIHTSNELARIIPSAGYHVDFADYSIPLRGIDGEIIFGLGRFLTAAFSPDGTSFAAASPLGVFLWDANDLRAPPRRWIRGYMENVVSLQFSHDGKKLLTGSAMGNIHLVDIEKGKENIAYRAHPGTPIRLIAFSPDNSLFATASTDSYIRVWKTDSGKLHNLILCTHLVSSLAFSFDNALLLYSGDRFGRTLVAGQPPEENRYSCVVNDLVQEKEIERYEDDVSAFTQTIFSPAGDKIIAGGLKGIKAWDRQTGASQMLAVNESPTAVAIAPHEVTQTVSLPMVSQPVTMAAFSPNADRFFLCMDGSEIQLWDINTSKRLLKFSYQNKYLRPAALNPDFTQVLLHDHLSETVVLRDLAANRTLATLDAFAASVQSVAFATESAQVASIHYPLAEKRWDADSGQLLSIHSENEGFLPLRSLSSNKRFTVYITESQPYNEASELLFHVKNLKSGVKSILFKQKSLGSLQYDFSPNGYEVLATGDNGEFAIWNLQTGEKRLTFNLLQDFKAQLPSQYLSMADYNTNRNVHYSPDGQRFLVSHSRNITKTSYQTAVVLFGDDAKQKIFRLILDEEYIYSSIFSSDGSLIALNGLSKIYVIDSNNGNMLRIIPKSNEPVSSFFTQDGKRLLIASIYHPLQLWDIQTGALIRTIGRAPLSVSASAFSPDDSQLLTGGDDGVVRLWNLSK
ncbi:MAG: WD40 repeat domain-containing protein [Candidatus Omnitrophota bacterium]